MCSSDLEHQNEQAKHQNGGAPPTFSVLRLLVLMLRLFFVVLRLLFLASHQPIAGREDWFYLCNRTFTMTFSVSIDVKALKRENLPVNVRLATEPPFHRCVQAGFSTCGTVAAG